MNVLTIQRPDLPRLEATIDLPLSKSIGNRLLIMDFLSGKPAAGPLRSTAGDTLVLQDLLGRIHISSSMNEDPTVLDAGDAGTVMRFLTALLAITPGRWLLTGSARLCQRPVGTLVTALESLGARIGYTGQAGFLPLMITGGALRGSAVEVDGSETSQFASALLLIAPVLSNGLRLTLTGEPASRPYLDLTLGMMQQAGIRLTTEGRVITVQPGCYRPEAVAEEADWSAAAFWYEIAALSATASFRMPGLRSPSLQGDSVVRQLFEPLGVVTGDAGNGILIRKTRVAVQAGRADQAPAEVCFLDFPDLALPVIATYAALGLPGLFSGLQNLRIKESDRARALVCELSALGVSIRLEPDGDRIILKESGNPPAGQPSRLFETYGDHRMAMVLAPLALRTGSIRINDPGVVAKSYPGFWDQLKKTGFRLH